MEVRVRDSESKSECVFPLRPVDAALQLQIHLVCFHTFRKSNPSRFFNPVAKTKNRTNTNQIQESVHTLHILSTSSPTRLPLLLHPALSSHQPNPQNGPVRFHLPPSQTATLTPASISTLYPFPPVAPVPVDDDDNTARNPTRGWRLSTVAYRNCAGLPTPAVQK